MTALPLVMVGYRRAFHRAIRARGFPLWIVDDVPPPHLDGAHFVASPLDTIERAAEQLPARVRRVVVSAERLVLPAARLSRALRASGVSFDTARLFRDKLAMKDALRTLAIPHARHAGWPGPDLLRLVREAGLPLVVKPRLATSGVGRRVAGSRRELERILTALLARFPDGLLVEESFRAREISVETFVSRGAVVFRSSTDYVAYGTANRVPAVLDAATALRAFALAERATLGLGLTSGVSHAEFFLTEKGPVLSEIACRPPGGHLFALIGLAWQVEPWELYLSCLLDEPVHAPSRPARWAGNLILHPPAGRIKRVRGLSRLKHLPGLVSLRHSLAAGDDVPTRTSLGQMRGVVTLAAGDPATVQRGLHAALASVQIDMERGSEPVL